jgi:hypothetical protein
MHKGTLNGRIGCDKLSNLTEIGKFIVIKKGVMLIFASKEGRNGELWELWELWEL